MLPDSSEPVLLFDGVCNLCNRFVQLVIKNDKQARFRFSSLQSGTGEEVKQQLLQDTGTVPDSLILLYKGKFYTRSAAAIKTAQLLGGTWQLLAIGNIFPNKMRDAIYNMVARNRYKWFGKKDECMVPTPELNDRFLN